MYTFPTEGGKNLNIASLTTERFSLKIRINQVLLSDLRDS